MSDLISREELLKQIETDSKGHEGQYGDEWLFIDTINSIPTAEPKVGKWTNAGALLTVCCSNCKSQFHELEALNFCPNCGARMKRRADEHTDQGH